MCEFLTIILTLILFVIGGGWIVSKLPNEYRLMFGFFWIFAGPPISMYSAIKITSSIGMRCQFDNNSDCQVEYGPRINVLVNCDH